MTDQAPPFPQQRLVCVSLLGGVAMYMGVVAFLLSGTAGKGLGSERIPILDDVALGAGAVLAITAFVVRQLLHGAAANAAPAERGMKRFIGTLAALAMLEGGCMLGITIWLVNGNAMPSLAVALVLFALAIVVVPFSDPDARES